MPARAELNSQRPALPPPGRSGRWIDRYPSYVVLRNHPSGGPRIVAKTWTWNPGDSQTTLGAEDSLGFDVLTGSIDDGVTLSRDYLERPVRVSRTHQGLPTFIVLETPPPDQPEMRPLTPVYLQAFDRREQVGYVTRYLQLERIQYDDADRISRRDVYEQLTQYWHFGCRETVCWPAKTYQYSYDDQGRLIANCRFKYDDQGHRRISRVWLKTHQPIGGANVRTTTAFYEEPAALPNALQRGVCLESVSVTDTDPTTRERIANGGYGFVPSRFYIAPKYPFSVSGFDRALIWPGTQTLHREKPQEQRRANFINWQTLPKTVEAPSFIDEEGYRRFLDGENLLRVGSDPLDYREPASVGFGDYHSCLTVAEPLTCLALIQLILSGKLHIDCSKPAHPYAHFYTSSPFGEDARNTALAFTRLPEVVVQAVDDLQSGKALNFLQYYEALDEAMGSSEVLAMMFRNFLHGFGNHDFDQTLDVLRDPSRFPAILQIRYRHLLPREHQAE